MKFEYELLRLIFKNLESEVHEEQCGIGLFDSLIELLGGSDKFSLHMRIDSNDYYDKEFSKSSYCLEYKLDHRGLYGSVNLTFHIHHTLKLKSCEEEQIKTSFILLERYLMMVTKVVRNSRHAQVLNEEFPTAMLDCHLRIVQCNQLFESFLSKHDQSNISSFRPLLSPDLEHEFRAACLKATRGVTSCVDLPNPNQSKLPFKVKVVPISQQRYRGVLVIVLNAQAKSLGVYKLSHSELSIAANIQQGRKAKEIAGIIGVSPDTVRWHFKQIRRKLGITNSKCSLNSFLLEFPPIITP